MFLSLDVEPSPEYFSNEHRSYFVWEFDKVPEVTLEIVSNRKGNEMDAKMQRYARIGIGYYVVFDPFLCLRGDVLQVLELTLGGRRYHRRQDFLWPEMGLSLQLWHGEFEGTEAEWLRWCDTRGNLIPTGAERAATEAERANAETQRADTEAQRANAEARRADQAEAELEKLRAELQRLQNNG